MTAEIKIVLAGGRLCECGCGRSIAHKRSDALTFDANCRKRLQRQIADDEHSVEADQSSHLRWQSTLALAAAIEEAEHLISLTESNREAGETVVSGLTRERLALLGAKPCGCALPIVLPDPDGDAVCAACGHAAGPVTATVNGFDRVEAAMIANGWAKRDGRSTHRVRVVA